jgi:hypothetical protein
MYTVKKIKLNSKEKAVDKSRVLTFVRAQQITLHSLISIIPPLRSKGPPQTQIRMNN